MITFLIIADVVAANIIFFVCGYKCGVRDLTRIVDKKIEDIIKEQENERINESKDNADGGVEG